MAFPLRLARLERDATSGRLDPTEPMLPPSFRLRTAGDVVALLERQIEAGAADPRAATLEKARAIGYLAALGLKAIEVSNLAARLEALEGALKRREGKEGAAR
jgi:hypothetical protein